MSRRCTPSIERPEPRSSDSLARANAIVGRWNFSLTREATRPTTPWCQSSSNRQIVLAASTVSASSFASASSCMSLSISRRSRLSWSSCRASSSPRSKLSVARHSMPTVMSVRRPAALMRGPIAKPRSIARAVRASLPATWNSAAIPACSRPLRMRSSPCATRIRLLRSSRTTSATVPSATRSSSAIEPRLRGGREAAAGAQFRAQRQQHVEHHADAREVLAREAAARLVRVDDARGVRQHRAGQVMVGDEHGDAEFVGARHALDARDAVVDGDDQVGRRLRGELDDLRRQPVAVLEAVRHEVVDLRAHRPQAAQRRPRRRSRRRSRSRPRSAGAPRPRSRRRAGSRRRSRATARSAAPAGRSATAGRPGARCRAPPARAPARAARRRRRGAAPRPGRSRERAGGSFGERRFGGRGAPELQAVGRPGTAAGAASPRRSGRGRACPRGRAARGAGRGRAARRSSPSSPAAGAGRGGRTTRPAPVARRRAGRRQPRCRPPARRRATRVRRPARRKGGARQRRPAAAAVQPHAVHRRFAARFARLVHRVRVPRHLDLGQQPAPRRGVAALRAARCAAAGRARPRAAARPVPTGAPCAGTSGRPMRTNSAPASAARCVGGGDQRAGVVVRGRRGQRRERHVIAREPRGAPGRRATGTGRAPGRGPRGRRPHTARWRAALRPGTGARRATRGAAAPRASESPATLRAREQGRQPGRCERLGERAHDFARQQGARQQQRDMHRPILRSPSRASGAHGGRARGTGWLQSPAIRRLPGRNATP